MHKNNSMGSVALKSKKFGVVGSPIFIGNFNSKLWKDDAGKKIS